jgi:hypothetical protein
MLGQQLAALSHVMAPATGQEPATPPHALPPEAAASWEQLEERLESHLTARLDAGFAKLLTQIGNTQPGSQSPPPEQLERMMAEKTNSLFEALKEEIAALGQSRARAGRREIDRVLYMVLGIVGGVFAVELWFAMKP